MKRPLNLSQNDLDAMAKVADELYNWLQEEAQSESEVRKSIRIPHHLNIVTTIAMVYAIPILLDPLNPSSICWFGGCTI